MHDQELRQLLNKFELSWEGYRRVRKGVKKRINRHMQQLGCRDFSDYLCELAQHETTRITCERLLTVSISRFFRDRNLWFNLENKILPDLIKIGKGNLYVLSLGCACGEEVYSFKIVWDQVRNAAVRLPELEITATDLNPDYIERAQEAVYSTSSLKELPAEIKSRYFEPIKEKSLFRVKPFLKDNINWSIQNILTVSPERFYQIIFMRNNLLTYYQDRIKKIAFKKIVNVLVPSGILIIGSHEELPFIPVNLVKHPENPNVFVKRENSDEQIH